jgi:RNA polymerase primary sigma factor
MLYESLDYAHEDEYARANRTEQHNSELEELKLMLNVAELPDQQITDDEWQLYSKRLGGGDLAAKDELIPRLYRRAYSRAKWYSDKVEPEDLSIEDHFQNALEGAFEAIDKYIVDPSSDLYQDICFRMWVSIARHANASRLVIFSRRFMERIQLIERARDEIADQKGIADAKDVLTDHVAMKTELSKKEIEAKELIYNAFSHSQLVSGIDLDQIPTDDNLVIEGLASEAQIESLYEAMNLLSEKERTVLELRFGFSDEPLTQVQIGRMFNVTRERARQIEKYALKKLRELPIIDRVQDVPEGFVLHSEPPKDKRAGMPKKKIDK